MIVAVVITIIFYVTLILELTVWHIPSIATSGKILMAEANLVDQYSGRFKSIFELDRTKKFIIFIIPLVFIFILHFYPLMVFYDFIQENPRLSLLYYLIASSIVLLGRLGSLVYIFKIRKQNDQIGDRFSLHTDSIFSYSRNPGLVSLYVSFIGFGLMIPSTFYFLCFAIYIAHMHFKILMEENFLSNKFGEDYSNYIKKSNRYVWF